MQRFQRILNCTINEANCSCVVFKSKSGLRKIHIEFLQKSRTNSQTFFTAGKCAANGGISWKIKHFTGQYSNQIFITVEQKKRGYRFKMFFDSYRNFCAIVNQQAHLQVTVIWKIYSQKAWKPFRGPIIKAHHAGNFGTSDSTMTPRIDSDFITDEIRFCLSIPITGYPCLETARSSCRGASVQRTGGNLIESRFRLPSFLSKKSWLVNTLTRRPAKSGLFSAFQLREQTLKKL